MMLLPFSVSVGVAEAVGIVAATAIDAAVVIHSMAICFLNAKEFRTSLKGEIRGAHPSHEAPENHTFLCVSGLFIPIQF